MQSYRTIVADPPWPYEAFATLRGKCSVAEVKRGWRESVRIRQEPLPYEPLSLPALAALPVGDLADRDCRLFLWTTQRFLPAAITDLLPAWGFQYRQTLVWHKTSSYSPFGGSVAPNDVEFMLVARRGSPPVLSRAKTCVIATPGFAGRRKQNGAGPIKHSQKPEAFLDHIEQISPGPYVELFARRARFGWDYWGNESLGTAEMRTNAG